MATPKRPPRPYKPGPPALPAVAQQLLSQLTQNQQINQSAYNNVAAYYRSEPDDSKRFKRAVEIAQAIDQNRPPIPFGTMFAVAEHESARTFNPAIHGILVSAEKGRGNGLYQIMDQFLNSYGVSDAGAHDPAISTRAVVNRNLRHMHDLLQWLAPSIIREDYILYTYCVYAVNLMGLGDTAGCPNARNAITSGNWKWGNRKGAAPYVVRAINYGKGKLTLEGMIQAADYMKQTKNGVVIRTHFESALGVLSTAMRGPIWEKRRDKLLKGDTRGLNDPTILIAALESARSKGQQISAEVLRNKVFVATRSSQEVTKTRQEQFAGAAKNSGVAAGQSGAGVRNDTVTAQKADLTKLAGISGPRQVYSWETGLWSVRTGAG